jgi:glutamate-ammonia-ligase adenylyltransferase
VILALGKLGSGTLDYGSDLDMIVSYVPNDDEAAGGRAAEVYSRGVESFVNFLSGVTREGNLYRVDLRLRPHGKNGPNILTVESLCDYIAKNASVWELLAYAQFRTLGDEMSEAPACERRIRNVIGERVAAEDPDKLRIESREMRLKLEETHGRPRGGNEIDIKFGSGGLLDVYFVVRFVQLTAMGKIAPEVRSTSSKLDEFARLGLISSDHYSSLSQGHRFLSELDHNIRLTIGRSSRYPRANHPVLERIAERMKLDSVEGLSQQLSLHRMNVRESFDRILFS